MRPRDKQARFDDIISILSDNDEVQYTTIKDKIELSDNVLSRYLKQLAEDGIITSRRLGKNKLYKISEDKLNDIRFKKMSIKTQYQTNFSMKMLDPEFIKMNDRMFEEVEKTMSALLFKIIFIGLNKGENWLNVFSVEEFVNSITYTIIMKIMKNKVPMNIDNILSTTDMGKMFKEFKEIKLTDVEIKKIKELEDYMNQRYLDKLKQLSF